MVGLLQYVMATAGDDGCVRVWDTRNASKPVLTQQHHSHWLACATIFIVNAAKLSFFESSSSFARTHTRTHTHTHIRTHTHTYAHTHTHSFHFSSSIHQPRCLRVWCVRYNPFYDRLVLTAGSDGEVCGACVLSVRACVCAFCNESLEFTLLTSSLCARARVCVCVCGVILAGAPEQHCHVVL